MKFRVGRKKGTVILDEVGSVVTEFVYKKSDGEAQRLANEYVAFKNANEPTEEEIANLAWVTQSVANVEFTFGEAFHAGFMAAWYKLKDHR